MLATLSRELARNPRAYSTIFRVCVCISRAWRPARRKRPAREKAAGLTAGRDTRKNESGGRKFNQASWIAKVLPPMAHPAVENLAAHALNYRLERSSWKKSPSSPRVCRARARTLALALVLSYEIIERAIESSIPVVANQRRVSNDNESARHGERFSCGNRGGRSCLEKVDDTQLTPGALRSRGFAEDL